MAGFSGSEGVKEKRTKDKSNKNKFNLLDKFKHKSDETLCEIPKIEEAINTTEANVGRYSKEVLKITAPNPLSKSTFDTNTEKDDRIKVVYSSFILGSYAPYYNNESVSSKGNLSNVIKTRINEAQNSTTDTANSKAKRKKVEVDIF